MYTDDNTVYSGFKNESASENYFILRFLSNAVPYTPGAKVVHAVKLYNVQYKFSQPKLYLQTRFPVSKTDLNG